MNNRKTSRFRRIAPMLLAVAMMACLISYGNARPLDSSPAATSVGAPLPAGFENFSEYRVFAKYADSINGYDVKVMIFPKYSTWRGTCRAVINFSNREGGFKIVHDGWRAERLYDEDKQLMLVPNNTVMTLSYNKPALPSDKPFTLELFADMPFVFYDIDFDGKDELLINLVAQAQRWRNAYEVVEPEPDRLYSIFRKPPFTELDDMTIIDPAKKTITISEYEGHGEELHSVYKMVTEETYYAPPKAVKQYTDDICYWGVDPDTIPMYRRIYTHEHNDTTGWKPVKNRI